MPLSAENFLQENTGGSSTTSTTAAPSLASGTTAGSTLVAVLNLGAAAGSVTLPTGWSSAISLAHNSVEGFIVAYKSGVAAGETSWTFTAGTAVAWAWYVAEVTGLDPAQPVDVTATADNNTALTGGSGAVTRSSGTTGATAGLDIVALAVHASCCANFTTLGTWTAPTNGFEQVATAASTVTGTVTNKGLSICRLASSGVAATYECTATYTPGASGSQHGFGAIVVCRSATSQIVTPITWMMGFDHGTANGLVIDTSSPVSGVLGIAALVDDWSGTTTTTLVAGTDVIVQTSSSRDGIGYGCRLVQAANIRYFGPATGQYGTNRTVLTLGWNVRVVSSTGTVVLAELVPATGTTLQVVYDTATTKLGLRWGSGGTASWESGTTAANTWRWIDLRISGIATATWHADWRLESVDQTSPADLTGQTPTPQVSTIHFGGNVSQTVTQDIDDLHLSAFYSTYPLGPHKVRALKVDAAGTVTLSGTTTNFSTFSAMTTLAAWNATTARDAVVELPPLISAASTGFTQTATAASDYVELPMETYTAAVNEAIIAAKVIAVLWGGTGAGTGTLGIRGYDGSAETVLQGTTMSYDAGSLTTQDIRDPVIFAYMWTPTGGWTQAKLDAAAIRVGFSSDATPDMGIHAIYLECSVRATSTVRLFGDTGDVTVDAERNPNTLGIRSLAATTPGGKGAVLHYELNASPTDVTVAAASSGAATLDAIDAPTANYVAIYPDPEGIPDA